MNNLTVNILDVYGLGIIGRYVSLPVGQVITEIHPDPNRIPAHKLKVLTKLIAAGDEHAKIVRQIHAHLEIRAPRYWWTQFATYESGREMYSGSTMHTLMKRPTAQEEFTQEVSYRVMEVLDGAIETKDLVRAKANLPEGYLQTRLILVSYQALRRIWLQRRGHKLPEWTEFIRATRDLPYASELVFVEPRSPWRKLWDRVLANEELPWVWTQHSDGPDCIFCGEEHPHHESACPYAKAQAMVIKEITDVITE